MSKPQSSSPAGPETAPPETPETPELWEVPSSRMRLKTLGRVAPAMVVMLACVGLSYLPGLEWARPWTSEDPIPFWNLLGRPFEGEAARAKEDRAKEVDDFARDALAQGDPEPVIRDEPDPVVLDVGDALPEYVAQPGDDDPVAQPLELFTGHELDGFFANLARADGAVEGAHARVLHWGDSAIGLDGIPGAIRARMQARFGDAGHGFHLVEPANTSYRHRQVDFEHNEGWVSCFIIRKCKDDGRYGLGGLTSWSSGGAKSSFAPNPKRSSDRVSHFEVAYLAGPKGGNFTVKVDDGENVVVETRAEVAEDRWYAVDVEDGHHEFTVRAAGGGKVRLYGVTMDRAAPGVEWDSLALVGAFTNRLRAYDQDHLRAQLEHREADLAVFMFGGNDMIRKSMSQADYEAEYREVLQLIKGAKPDMACLIMTPLDHGDRKGVRIVSLPVVPMLVAAQRNVAEAEGCAFFDTYAAMGGEGSAGRWYNHSPRLIGGDLSHATSKGHVVIGEMFYRGLLQQYIAYRKREG